MTEQPRKFFWKLRSMWTAADIVFESQRNVLGMTIELAREVERRIKLKRENDRLRKGLHELAQYDYRLGIDSMRDYAYALLKEQTCKSSS